MNKTLPSLGSLHAQLAVNNLRVANMAERLESLMDEVVQSAMAEDAQSVRDVCERILRVPANSPCAVLQPEAQSLRTMIDQGAHPQAIRRGVLRLVGKYGRMTTSPKAEGTMA